MSSIAVLRMDQFQQMHHHAEFYCNTLQAHLKESHQHVERAHRHNFYLVLYITKGSGRHDIDFNSYDLQEGSLFFMSPGQIHAWELSKDIEGYIFFFSSDFFNLYLSEVNAKDFPFFGSLNAARKLQLEPHDASDVVILFKTIYQEYCTESLLRMTMIRNLVSVILVKSARFFLEQNSPDNIMDSPSYLVKIQQFEELLERWFLKEKAVGFYAKHLDITPKHLNRISQSILGIKASNVIANRTILEAKRMLVYSEESLSDIAFRLGFNEYPYFTRFFKKQTGITPSQFLSIQNKF